MVEIAKIPKQIQEERFIKVIKNEKNPKEKKWQVDKNYTKEDKILLLHDGNVGMLTGYGVIVFDADTKRMNELAQKLPKTLVIQTSMSKKEPGYRKRHYYFKSDMTKKMILKDNGEHLGEIQARGQFVVIPPSKHPDGLFYEVAEDRAIAELSEADLRKVVSPFLTSGAGKAIDITEITKGANKGNRNDSAFRLATFHRKGGADKQEAYNLLSGWNGKNNPPLGEDEIKDIVDSAYSTEKPYRVSFEQNPKTGISEEVGSNTNTSTTSTTSTTLYVWGACFDDKKLIIEQISSYYFIYNYNGRLGLAQVKPYDILDDILRDYLMIHTFLLVYL